MRDLRKLSPNDQKKLEDWVTKILAKRNEQAPRDRLTPRMEAHDILKTVGIFLDKLDEEEREFTHCIGCGEANGTNPDCEACADYRVTAASEHQAAEQETDADPQPDQCGGSGEDR